MSGARGKSPGGFLIPARGGDNPLDRNSDAGGFVLGGENYENAGKGKVGNGVGDRGDSEKSVPFPNGVKGTNFYRASR